MIVDPATSQYYCCADIRTGDFRGQRKLVLRVGRQVDCLKHQFSSNFEMCASRSSPSPTTDCSTNRRYLNLDTLIEPLDTGDTICSLGR